MSDEKNLPSAEAVRAARHQGFNDAVGYAPTERRERLAGSYTPQDARREKNITSFASQVRGPG